MKTKAQSALEQPILAHSPPTMAAGLVLLRVIVGAIGLLTAACGKDGDKNGGIRSEPPGAGEHPAIKKLTDEEITGHVRRSLFDTLGKLTPHRSKPDVYLAFIFFEVDRRPGKKAFAEFTIHPDQFKINYSREAPSPYEQENGIDRVTVDRIDGFTVRVMQDLNYPAFHEWSSSEAATELLGWKWEIKASPDQGTNVREIRESKLDAFPRGRMTTLYPPEQEPNKWASAALDQFNMAVGRYFKATTADNGMQSIIWATQETHDNPVTLDTYSLPRTAFQCKGKTITLSEDLEVDEEGQKAGVKHRGILERVFGTQFRYAQRNAQKWSQWWTGMMVVRCYYQVDSSENIQWVANVNQDGGTQIPEEHGQAPSPLFDPVKVWRVVLCHLDASQTRPPVPEGLIGKSYPDDHRPRESTSAPGELASCSVAPWGAGDLMDKWNPNASSSAELRGWRLALAAEKPPGPNYKLFAAGPSWIHAEVSKNIPGDAKEMNPAEAPTAGAVLDSCKTR